MSEPQMISLEELMAKRAGSLNPSKFPDDQFDLYSIPAFDKGCHEVVTGSEIGSTKQLVEPNDVLLSKIVPHIRRSWVVGQNNGRRMIASGEWIVFRSKKTDPAYLRHVLIGDPFHSQFMQTVSGVGGSLLRARPAHVAKIKIPLPPLPEQRRISAILDKADVLRTKRQEAIEKLDSLSQSIFIDMFGDPATNPRCFPKKTLGQIIKFEGGSQPPASTFVTEEAPDYIRLVQIRDFKSDRFKTYIPRNLCKRFFEEDDVMVGRYGPPVFQILRGLSGSYNVALMKAVPRERVTKEFIFHLLREERLHNFVVANSERTAGQSGVNLELLEKYQAYLPPMELQIQFSQKMAQLKALTQSMNTAHFQSNSLFASLQHRAFRGKL